MDHNRCSGHVDGDASRSAGVPGYFNSDFVSGVSGRCRFDDGIQKSQAAVNVEIPVSRGQTTVRSGCERYGVSGYAILHGVDDGVQIGSP